VNETTSSTSGYVRILLLLGGLSALGPVSLDLYFPALPSLPAEFEVSTSMTQLTVGAFLLGLGLGQPIAGPLSDMFGRRKPILISIALYLVATVACVIAPTMELLVASRLLQGIFASAGIVIARAIVRDLYVGAPAARLLSHLVMIYGLAPLLAPLIGGLLLTFTNWQGTFITMAAFGLILFVLVAAGLPETLPNELRRSGEIKHQLKVFPNFLRDRIFLGYALALGLGTACIIAYISASSFVLQDVYGVSPQIYGVLFGINAAAMIASSQVNAALVGRRDPAKLLKVAGFALVSASTLLLVAVVLGLGLWAVTLCLVAMMGCWGFIPANAISLAMVDYREAAGSASAVLGIFQYGMGGIVTPLVGVGGENTALPMAIVILVSALALFTAIRVNGRQTAIQ